MSTAKTGEWRKDRQIIATKVNPPYAPGFNNPNLPGFAPLTTEEIGTWMAAVTEESLRSGEVHPRPLVHKCADQSAPRSPRTRHRVELPEGSPHRC